VIRLLILAAGIAVLPVVVAHYVGVPHA